MTHSHASTEDARAALEQVDRLRSDARADLSAFWFPLVLFGALTVLSALPAARGDGTGVAIFWAFAGPLGGIAVGMYSYWHEQRVGLSRPPAPFIVTAGALLVAAFALPAVTSGRLQEVVSAFAVAGAYLVFARLERSVVLVGVSVVMATVPALALASSLEHPGAPTAAATGVILLATGLATRSRQQNRR